MRIIKAGERHYEDFGWLRTNWLFSFADYYDPMNIQFGALRVFNDDTVMPGMGFPTHPHREMEIVTIVLTGEITHADSMGNKATIKAGDVQRMSAGTGLTHSEFNLGREPAHFYQIWILPDRAGLRPGYDQREFNSGARSNRLLPVASGQDFPGAVTIHTDATIYLSNIDAGRIITFNTEPSRRIFVYVTSGEVGANEANLSKGDQARIDPDSPAIRLRAYRDAGLVLIDVPSCRGWGYDKKTLQGSKF